MKSNNSKKIFSRIGGRIKESVRRFLVSLKKNPQSVPLAGLCVAFLEYSLNLTDISNTTAKLQGANMGLAAFVTMLFMILSFVCMLNAFPKRQKPNLAMIILMVVLYGAIIFADIHYLNTVDYALINSAGSLNNEAIVYIYNAYNTITVHMILIGVTILLVLLEPLIAKLLKKINTSIEVEVSGDIGNIDIVDED